MPGRPACGVVPAVAVRGGFSRRSPLTRDTEAVGSGVTTRGGPQTATVLLSWWALGHVSSKDPGRRPPAGPAHGAEGQGEANPTAARARNPGAPGLTLHTPPPGLAQEQDLARGRASQRQNRDTRSGKGPGVRGQRVGQRTLLGTVGSRRPRAWRDAGRSGLRR